MKVKKNTIILLLTLLFCIIFGIFLLTKTLFRGLWINYDNWQSVSIPEVGWIKVPQDWMIKEIDGYLYMTDGSKNSEGRYNILLIARPLLLNENSPVQADKDDIMVKPRTYISSTVLSNSTEYGVEEITISGDKKQMPFLSFYGVDHSIYFWAWDNLVDKDTIYKIAYSFTTGESNN